MAFASTLRPIYFSFASLAIGLLFAFPGMAAETELDTDGDGISDAQELKFGLSPTLADTDGDGYADGIELHSGFDPRDPAPKKLKKIVVINLKKQELSYGWGDLMIATHKVSTGKRGFATPRGEFKIRNHVPKAWSRTYKLWMPNWMAFTPYGHGIHELPIWPGGKREGANNLGIPVSHGCVRLGVGPAKALYDFAENGTRLVIK